MNNRDWQADKQTWDEFNNGWFPGGASNNRDAFVEFAYFAMDALPYWLQEVKKLCEVNQQEQRKILGLRIRLNAAKERADIAELAYQGLAENAVNRGEYQSLLDKHTAMTKVYRVEKERADQAEARELKLKEAIEVAINEKAQWGDAGNALDVVVRYLSDTLSILYPKEATE